MNCEQKYFPGDKIFDILRKKSGKIVNLRNDSREKKMRENNPSHYYYHIDYDDGSFDTYVNTNSLVKYDEKLCSTQLEYDQTVEAQTVEAQTVKDQTVKAQTQIVEYKPGQKFINARTNKIGTVKYLRNGEYEENKRNIDPTHYYYSVGYDDGSFETYECGELIIPTDT